MVTLLMSGLSERKRQQVILAGINSKCFQSIQKWSLQEYKQILNVKKIHTLKKRRVKSPVLLCNVIIHAMSFVGSLLGITVLLEHLTNDIKVF